MVRGNWQKRVETAQARRTEAKQKKARSEEKRIFKSMAQETLALLDQNMDAIRRRSSSPDDNGNSNSNKDSAAAWSIHIWTDSLPSESPPFLDIVEQDDVGKSSTRKARSSSMDDGDLTPNNGKGGKKKGRGRSISFQQEGGKSSKKVHPRSKEADAVPTDDHKTFAPMLCKSQFFSGRCQDPQKKGNKGGCRCVHYNNKQLKTLAAVLTGSSSNGESKMQHQGSLAKAEEACTANSTQDVSDSSGSGSMEMVYYLSLPIPSNIGSMESTTGSTDDTNNTESKDEEPSPSNSNIMSHLITEKLSENACSIASIVYMVISSPSQDTLLYDRNREGTVVSDFAAEVLASGGGGEIADGDEVLGIFQAEHLPVAILEHILAYVEAPTVAAVAQVCTSWRREMSSCSPSLWRGLLKQRSWPAPRGTSEDIDESATSVPDTETSASLATGLKEEFVKHYSVFRDMRAIQMALTGMLTKRNCPEEEMAFQTFSTRRGAPQAPNNCVAVEIWGPNQVLAAYSDNTLRLFQTQPRGSHGHAKVGSNIEKSCRELLCQTIDPYTYTKKKSCFLEAIGLDEDVVGCLCSVSDESSDDKTPHILVIIRREDLLVVDFSTDTAGRSELEEGSLRVIDVEEAVLNYVLSLDHVDHRLLRLHDFLALGGDQEEVEFIVSQSMAACGFGRFMLEVAISIPALNDDEDNLAGGDLAGDMLLLDRKLFLFSSSVGAIVWMGDSNPPNEPLPSRLEDMTMANIRRALPGGGSRTSCTVASVSHAFAPAIMSCEIEHGGTIDGHFVLGSSEWTETERLAGEGWTLQPDGKRPIVVTPTDIVVGDSLATQPNGNGERQYKSTITFYSRFPGLDDNVDSISKLDVGKNCAIDRMVGFRDDYVLLLVRFFTETGFAAVDGGGGHWGTDRVGKVFALTIHVPTRREIDRMCLYEDFGFNKLTLAVCGDTVACGVWLKGMIMTGPDVRSVGVNSAKSVIVLEDQGTKASKKKAKNKRKSKGSGKKDGFARGQSLRG